MLHQEATVTQMSSRTDYDPLGFSFDYRWRDLGIYIAYIIFNAAVAILACKFLTLRYSKR